MTYKTAPRKSKSEAALEDDLRKGVLRLGGRALKLQKLPGWPDRIVVWPDGTVDWVEMKKPSGRVAKHQALAHEILRDMQHCMFVLWNEADINAYLAEAHDRLKKAGVLKC